jgi:two-component system nitrate/nitrite sensor histidine kinase NarX
VGVVVNDDGVGFETQAIATHMNHAGLRGMQERAHELGATVKIDSRPGWGTTVRFNLAARRGDA